MRNEAVLVVGAELNELDPESGDHAPCSAPQHGYGKTKMVKYKYANHQQLHRTQRGCECFFQCDDSWKAWEGIAQGLHPPSRPLAGHQEMFDRTTRRAENEAALAEKLEEVCIW